MGVDKVSVINRALGFVGERPITNPDNPETTPGKTMANNYDQCRREVQRRHPWNFCEMWATVDKTTAPAFGYDDAYTMPEDFLRLLVVGDPNQPTRDYRLLNQGAPNYRRVIACNNGGAATLQIAYASDVTLLSQWDPLALKVLSIWLAMDNAKAITGQDAHVQLLDNLLTKELQDAVAVDGQEQSINQLRWSYVQDARDEAQFGGSFTNVVGYY